MTPEIEQERESHLISPRQTHVIAVLWGVCVCVCVRARCFHLSRQQRSVFDRKQRFLSRWSEMNGLKIHMAVGKVGQGPCLSATECLALLFSHHTSCVHHFLVFIPVRHFLHLPSTCVSFTPQPPHHHLPPLLVTLLSPSAAASAASLIFLPRFIFCPSSGYWTRSGGVRRRRGGSWVTTPPCLTALS